MVFDLLMILSLVLVGEMFAFLVAFAMTSNRKYFDLSVMCLVASCVSALVGVYAGL